MAKARRDAHDQVTNVYFLGLSKLITDWAGGKEVFSGDHEIVDLSLSIAKLGRNACCGEDFSDARRFAALSCFEQNTGDVFVSLRQKPTVTRGRVLARVYPRSRASSHPNIVTERYDVYSAQFPDVARIHWSGDCLGGVAGTENLLDA